MNEKAYQNLKSYWDNRFDHAMDSDQLNHLLEEFFKPETATNSLKFAGWYLDETKMHGIEAVSDPLTITTLLPSQPDYLTSDPNVTAVSLVQVDFEQLQEIPIQLPSLILHHTRFGSIEASANEMQGVMRPGTGGGCVSWGKDTNQHSGWLSWSTNQHLDELITFLQIMRKITTTEEV